MPSPISNARPALPPPLNFGAYLAAPKFSGGGSAGLAFEIGLGIGVGPQGGRLRFTTDYDFQRIDREVNGAATPIQSLVTRAGAVVRF